MRLPLPVSPAEKELLRAVGRIAEKKKIKLYLVGGYLRDILLKRKKANPDLDFCLKKQAIGFARYVSKELRAGFVVLDELHGCGRVVKKSAGKIYTLDFSDFRGRDIHDDLLHRDFTVNAMALEIDGIGRGALKDALLDPYAGRRDLKSGRIRMVNKGAFDEDPLRVLRAFSLAAVFGFRIHPETLRLCANKAEKLSGVSWERIRDELFKILQSPVAFACLQQMDALGVLKVIMPEIEKMRGVNQGPYHHLDIWRHSLETLRQAELLFEEAGRSKDLREYLEASICGERKRNGLLKLAALLHDIGKPRALRREEGKIKFHGHEAIGRDIAECIALRLKLSNDETSCLKRIIFCHLRPGYLADNEELTPRAKFRYFRDTQDDAPAVLLVSLADQRSTRGRLTTKEGRLRHERVSARLIKEYFRKKKEKKEPRVLNGNDLIREFKLTPSPLVGKLLRELEELQAIGRIKSKAEALAAARSLLAREKGKR